MSEEKKIKVDSAVSSEDKSKIIVKAHCTDYVTREEIEEFKNSVKEKSGEVPVVFEIDEYKPGGELEDASDLKEAVMAGLGKESIVIYTQLKKSSFMKDGNTLRIAVKRSVRELFERLDVKKAIENFLENNGHKLSVEFDYEFSLDHKDNNSFSIGMTREEFNRSRQTAVKSQEAYSRIYGGGGTGRGYSRGNGKISRNRRITPPEGEKLPEDSEGCKILIGKAIKEKIVTMNQIDGDSGFVAVKGRLFKFENREIPSGSMLAICYITDKTNSVPVKFFYEKDDAKFVEDTLDPKKKVCLKVYGESLTDKYSRETTIKARCVSIYYETPREDKAEEKRVELHLHTNMSALDALTDPSEVVKTAIRWGHPAVAITDHGVVQAYPAVFNELSDQQKNNPDLDFKIIYGIEAYITNQDRKLETKEENKQTPSYHCIILVKNLVGLKNLYELISLSNLEYFYKKPRMPKFEIEKRREGLIIGSACSEGELFKAFVAEKRDDEIESIASFYDYLEIQPTANDMYLVRDLEVRNIESEKDIENINKKIIALADKLGKKVVATCDVHFMNKEDEIYREIMQAGQGYKDAEQQAPLYFRTTDEMLAEFKYLGDRAKEVVIDNPKAVASEIEVIRPVPEGTFTPVIEGSNEQLRNSCYETAKKLYGDPLPEVVASRLEKELGGIINNGYSVMYVIAQKLVKHSEENGYTVGSRGSVGSSLAAFMSGITEVNSLEAHYICKNCGYIEWHGNEGLDCGYDLPRKDCPKCGKPLTREGFDIPFETFLGFNGDKVPDIDLNFATDDQSSAHKYTGVLFGEDHVFRAGTISEIKEKTARGYVLKYLELTGKQARDSEISRLASGFVGVKRTTGQHPGGIIVIPRQNEITDFTPVQHPAEKAGSDIITTHFDYRFLHDTILKLDILGHDGPELLKQFYELSGVNFTEAEIDDEKVLSLFSSSDALNMDPEKLKIDIPLGTLGIPEFGTGFVMGMLRDTLPKSISELIRISGLSHGENVWVGNAKDLIMNGTCTLKEAICCRDDIMLYLINKGIEKGTAFKITESVRKGNGLKPEWEELMLSNDVPEWYIDSCKKIHYMFPKAHATAYVILSLRVGWYKVYYPLAYYCARFTTKLSLFDAAIMIHGPERAYQQYAAVRESLGDEQTDKAEGNKEDEDEQQEEHETSNKEVVQCDLLKQVLEMYARGIEFLPVDLYKSDATRFLPEDGKIRPPFATIQGVGINAATALAEAGKTVGRYISVADVQSTTGINKATIEALRAEGCFDGMPETNQLTFV